MEKNLKSLLNLFVIKFESNRIYGLDIVRALAILFVVTGHSCHLLPETFDKFLNCFILDGVSIFFVLSGFLIGGILIKILEKKGAGVQNLFDFWIRRWFRTLPNYYLILGVLILYSLIFSPGFSIMSIKEHFYFSQSLYTPDPGFFPEGWSLEVEEWFYLLIPALIFLLIGIFGFSNKNALLFTFFSVVLLSLCFRYYRFSHMVIHSIWDWDFHFKRQCVTRLDSLMFGLLGAYLSYYYNSLWVRYKNISLAAGLILLTCIQFTGIMKMNGLGLYQCVFSFTLNSVSVLLILPFFSELKTGTGIIYTSLTYVSLISYSMYLINLSLVLWRVMPFMEKYNPGKDYTVEGMLFIITRFSAFWVMTVFGSILLYKFFERPCMNFRDRFKH